MRLLMDLAPPMSLTVVPGADSTCEYAPAPNSVKAKIACDGATDTWKFEWLELKLKLRQFLHHFDSAGKLHRIGSLDDDNVFMKLVNDTAKKELVKEVVCRREKHARKYRKASTFKVQMAADVRMRFTKQLTNYATAKKENTSYNNRAVPPSVAATPTATAAASANKENTSNNNRTVPPSATATPTATPTATAAAAAIYQAGISPLNATAMAACLLSCVCCGTCAPADDCGRLCQECMAATDKKEN